MGKLLTANKSNSAIAHGISNNNRILVIKADEVETVLNGRETEIVDLVSKIYVIHNKGLSSLPHSIFLRFPNNASNRIIGLPAYIGEELNIAGMKWISSFPDNINYGMERASALLILNDMQTGRVNTIMEGSIISAKRTAASAALAAKVLHDNGEETAVGIVGCGRINKEILSFLLVLFPKIEYIYLFDQNKERAESFKQHFCEKQLKGIIVESAEDIFSSAKLFSFATTAGAPYIKSINKCDEKSTILNISLRDFSPEVVEWCDNIVDDLDHVCREKTSIHLTEEKLNSREFVRGTLADVICNNIGKRISGKPTMFSPFGLGVLDLALGHMVQNKVLDQKKGTLVEDFFI